jgi:hypothetical protein
VGWGRRRREQNGDEEKVVEMKHGCRGCGHCQL